MEIVADGRGQRVRVAEDGVSNRDSIAGVAVAEAILSGLFEFEPTFRELAGTPLPRRIEFPGLGSVSNINTRLQTRHLTLRGRGSEETNGCLSI
jgi:hypothetical protein